MVLSSRYEPFNVLNEVKRLLKRDREAELGLVPFWSSIGRPRFREVAFRGANGSS